MCQDTLLTSPHVHGLFAEALPHAGSDGIDILIGNPPYVRSSLLPQAYSQELRTNYETVRKGNYDLSVAFIEHALATLSSDGLAAYVLTHKFMTSAYGRDVCRRLAAEARVLNIEDFQDYQVFPGYTTYTCVLTFARKTPAKRFTVTQFPQGLDGKGDPGPGETSSLPTTRLQSHPWDFTTDLAHTVLRLLRDPRHPLLKDVFGDILQGMRTGANTVFVVPAKQADIEPDLLVPFVTGEHIKRCCVEADQLRLIFPYRRTHFGEAVLLSEHELRENYPRAWSYLSKHRSVLEERSLDGRVPWYAYSRSQNLDLPYLRKLLVREMLPRAEFAADAEGRLAFCSGYCLSAQQMDADMLQLWTAVLCTPTMEFSLRHGGTQLQSGWFRLLEHHLRRLRLPSLNGKDLERATIHAASFASTPTDSEALQALDDIVAAAFGLHDKHRELLREHLADCHRRSMRMAGQPRSEDGPRASEDSRTFEPVTLSKYDHLHRDRPDLRDLVTFGRNKALPVHRWYRYTQGFSAQLVPQLIDELGLIRNDVVLDPFAGCGTTALVCRQQQIPSISIEISPLMVWVAETKVRPWRATELETLVASLKLPRNSAGANDTEHDGVFEDYLSKAFAQNILGQIRAYAREFETGDYAPRHKDFLKLALVSIMEDVSQIRKHGSHYRYMLKSENVGLHKLNIPILDPDTDIEPIFRNRLEAMIEDVRRASIPAPPAPCKIVLGDARRTELPDESVSAVITSPPYLNRNNYIAQQKAELAILGIVRKPADYRSLVRSTLRSHVEARFPGTPHTTFPEVDKILKALSLTDGNNPKIPHMIAGYFEDLAVTLNELRRVVRQRGMVVMVLGNTRWGGIVVPVDHLVLMIAEQRGFRAERVLVTRLKGNSPQQMRRYGRIAVRESIVVMRRV